MSRGALRESWERVARRALGGSLPRVDALLGALSLLSTGAAMLGRRAEVNGAGVWLLGDDAMISLHYARNLAAGNGLVFNPGERVEGFTNPLWTLWMTLGFAPGVPLGASAVPALLGCLAAVVALPIVTRRLAVAVGAPPLAALVAGVGVALSRDASRWAAEGFETVPLTLCAALAALRIQREASSGRLAPVTVALLAAIPLLRGDGVVLLALLAGVAWSAGLAPRALLRALAVPVGLFALSVAARRAYYGDVVPNTARLKVFSGGLRVALGGSYLWKGALAMPGLALAVALGAVVGPRPARQVARAVLAWCAWVLAIGGDAFPGRRFLLPALPLALAVAAAVLGSLPSRPWLRGALLLAAVLAIPLRVPGINETWAQPLDPRDRGNLEIGMLLRAHTPTGAVVADQWAGTTLFFAERRGVDLLGKVDRHVALRAPVYPGPAPGHNRWDLAWSLGTLRPDYVIAPTSWPLSQDLRAQLARPRLRFARALVEDERFLRACAPHPMPWPTWRAVLRCTWPPR